MMTTNNRFIVYEVSQILLTHSLFHCKTVSMHAPEMWKKSKTLLKIKISTIKNKPSKEASYFMKMKE